MTVLDWSDKTQVASYMRDYYRTHEGAKRQRIIPGATRASKTCQSCGILKMRDEFTVRKTGQRVGHLAGRCKACAVVQNKTAHQRDPSIYRRVEWPSKLKRLYGITVADYEAMLARQGGGCAMCGTTNPSKGPYTRDVFDVDHDHQTGKVRGLLCTRCNRAIGLIGDDSNTAAKMLTYLAENGR